jgi:hypothetical protein
MAMRSLFETPRAPPSGKSEAEEIAELMALGVNHPARRHRERELRAKNRALEKKWNSTPHRTTPANLTGIKCATKEPWAIDEQFYQKKTGSFEDEPNDAEVYDDRSALAASKGYRAEVTSTGLKGTSQPTWDSSPLRPVPHPLKGIKPETREPWCVE